MKSPTSRPSSRRSSRLGAVQALYQVEQISQNINTIIDEFINHRFSINEEGSAYFKPDLSFFKNLVLGVHENITELDRIIEENLAENWRLERLPSVMRAILRAACYELKNESLVPTPVIINEYIEIAKEFFQDKEVSFVNGILDMIAKQIRSVN